MLSNEGCEGILVLVEVFWLKDELRKMKKSPNPEWKKYFSFLAFLTKNYVSFSFNPREHFTNFNNYYQEIELYFLYPRTITFHAEDIHYGLLVIS